MGIAGQGYADDPTIVRLIARAAYGDESKASGWPHAVRSFPPQTALIHQSSM